MRNLGLSSLPAGVEVRLYKAPDTLVGAVFTSKMLLAGQTETLSFDLKPGDGGLMDSYYAEIYVDPVTPNFRECRPENNKSDVVTPDCIK